MQARRSWTPLLGLLLVALLVVRLSVLGADSPDAEASGDEVVALNVLDAQFVFPTMLGFGTFLAAAGLAVVRRRFLPVWLGWAALVLAAVAFTPAALLAFVLGLLWIAAVAVFLAVRPPPAARAS